jgi:hypothetical protein
MNLQEATSRAEQILVEEQTNPTVDYKDSWQATVGEMGKIHAFAAAVASASEMSNLNGERALQHRPVHENPNKFRFYSKNYELLIKLFQLLAEADRPIFIAFLLAKVADLDTAWSARGGQRFPCWDDCYSYLPLVAEFCIRTGHTGSLIESLLAPKVPSVGLIIMTMQLSEMVCLNFTVFSDAELGRLSEVIDELSNVGNPFTWLSKRVNGKVVKNPQYKPEYKRRSDELVSAIVSLSEQCRKARYFYLKGALQETTNWEIENDKSKVTGYLDSLGFDPAMKRSLETAEQHFGASASGFELKSCMGHLRSFLEQLHIQASAPIAASTGESAPTKWGPATLLLRTSGTISLTEEKFITSLYTLISDEAIHPLMTEREYARIRRNMVIEYGLMLLTVLDKKGISIRPLTTQTTNGTQP